MCEWKDVKLNIAHLGVVVTGHLLDDHVHQQRVLQEKDFVYIFKSPYVLSITSLNNPDLDIIYMLMPIFLMIRYYRSALTCANLRCGF